MSARLELVSEFVIDTRRALALTVVALVAFFAATWATLGFYLWRRDESSVALDGGFLAFLVVLVAVVVAHEAVHGLTVLAFGARPRFGLGVSGVFPYAYTTIDRTLSRTRFVAVALAPLVLLSGAGLVAIAVAAERLSPWFAFGTALNTAGAVADVWMAFVLLRYPASVLVEDRKSGFAIWRASSS